MTDEQSETVSESESDSNTATFENYPACQLDDTEIETVIKAIKEISSDIKIHNDHGSRNWTDQLSLWHLFACAP